MEKQILLPPKIQKEIDVRHKCGTNELWRALTYRRNSRRAKMLRVAALEAGGMIYTGAHAPNGFVPNVETEHDHANRIMRQRFGSRVELHASKDTHFAMIIIDGEPVATFNDMTIGNWKHVLYSESLGHTSLATTQIYLDSFDKDERIRNAKLLKIPM